MAMKITLSLDETVYERARLLAEAQREDVAMALANWLDNTLPPVDQDHAAGMADHDEKVMQHEMEAYIALHPGLVQLYKDQYVAIHNGQLVDHDIAYDALVTRIEAAYPEQFVWLTRVEEQPIRQLKFRSPRIEKHG
jgi:hypothetical protein